MCLFGEGEGNERMTNIHTDSISVFLELFKLKTPLRPHPSPSHGYLMAKEENQDTILVEPNFQFTT